MDVRFNGTKVSPASEWYNDVFRLYSHLPYRYMYVYMNVILGFICIETVVSMRETH